MQQSFSADVPLPVSNTENANHIAITFDDKYMQHACVMLQSLNAHLSVKVTVHCIFNNLDSKNQKLLTRHFAKSNIELNFVAFDNSVLPDLPIKQNDHVSPAAFFRIWLPHLLPHINKVLFLDSDIIITGNIMPLLDLNINDYAIAAVCDSMTNEKKAGLGIRNDSHYFNSGVMVMNLDYFRKHQLTQKLSEFITQYPHLCEFWDQDAFNAIMAGNFYRLDYKYNVQSFIFQTDDESHPGIIEQAAVIHFTGAGMNKPWFFHNKHPYKRLYYHYLVKTPFASYLPPDIPRSWRIFRVIRFILYKYLS